MSSKRMNDSRIQNIINQSARDKIIVEKKKKVPAITRFRLNRFSFVRTCLYAFAVVIFSIAIALTGRFFVTFGLHK